MSSIVYGIDCVDTHGNSHAVNRDETWIFKMVKNFDSKEEAQDYVRENSQRNPEFLRLSQGMSYGVRKEFLEQFCFDDKYIHYRRLFAGKPNKEKIRKMLEKDGIKVI